MKKIDLGQTDRKLANVGRAELVPCIGVNDFERIRLFGECPRVDAMRTGAWTSASEE